VSVYFLWHTLFFPIRTDMNSLGKMTSRNGTVSLAGVRSRKIGWTFRDENRVLEYRSIISQSTRGENPGNSK
jgi:hypothetical protein